MNKYKQYILLREKLLLEIPVFREKVGAREVGALPADLSAPATVSAGAEESAQAVARMKAAIEYKAKRAGGASGDNELPSAPVNADARVAAALKVRCRSVGRSLPAICSRRPLVSSYINVHTLYCILIGEDASASVWVAYRSIMSVHVITRAILKCVCHHVSTWQSLVCMVYVL